ncbi:leucine-rich repeat-containing protein 14 [Nematolebias whitei]|uniref:leucine-rich repeat-containing protein 14 n=1 Tax=Nematolebias whitei TaxID=451745 RepID=UPI00189763B4|nr:leucine-rich repeat-containing protein 14 [Nematolebias whitei]
MVLSLVRLCARELVSDHSLSPSWLRCMPRELYGALLEAAFDGRRPLAVLELVQRWPERSLRVGGRTEPGHTAPNRLCIQALLLAVVKGLLDQRSALQVLDICGLRADEGGMEGPMGGWSVTVALCTKVVQARAEVQRTQRKEGDRERKRFSDLERERDLKKERGQRQELSDDSMCSKREKLVLPCLASEAEQIKGVRRRMELERRRETAATGLGGSKSEMKEKETNDDVLVHVRADLFVNARSRKCVCLALGSSGPLKVHCRYLRVEEISVANIRTLLNLLPCRGFLGIDVRYSNLGAAGLAELLPHLSNFPELNSLRLYHCNLDLRRDRLGQEDVLRDLSQGLAQLKGLRRLSLTGLRLRGQLRVLLSSLPLPLELLELPNLSLSPADFAYLSRSHHAFALQQLDLSDNRLDENTLPSIGRLLSQSSSSLEHLTLSGCCLTDALLGLLLPSIGGCLKLKSLAITLIPLSMTGLMDLVRMAVKLPSLRLLLYPNPLELYEPGLPDLPSSVELLYWPMNEDADINTTSSQLNRVLIESGRSDLLLTCDLFSYDKDLK